MAAVATSILRRRRLALVAGVAGALVAPLSVYGAVGLEPETPPSAYAGGYVLLMNGKYAGTLHSVSGCQTQVTTRFNSLGAPSGVSRSDEPCDLQIGPSATRPFRDLVADAVIHTQPNFQQVHKFSVAKVGATASTGEAPILSELRFTGTVSAVTVPGVQVPSTSAPVWLGVQLRPNAGSITRVTPAGASVMPYPDTSFDASTAGVTLDTVSSGLAGTDPLVFTRRYSPEDQDRPTLREISREPVLRVSERRGTVETVENLAKWFDARMTGTTSTRTLRVQLAAAGGRSRLTVEVAAAPRTFDPFARTDGQRRLRLEVTPGRQQVESFTWND